jgi:hypothetical protein
MTGYRRKATFSRHDLPELCIISLPSQFEEGAGKAGYRLIPMAPVQ